MSSDLKVVVGLGNPGDQYNNTRHNVGFRVLAELAKRNGISSTQSKFESEIADYFLGNTKILLVAPQTYMNKSGRAVQKVFDYYNFELEDLIVVCDDLNLANARLRFRPSGSAGGQNGLNDIIRSFGGDLNVPRLRIGIGRPPGRMSSVDYVLGRFTKQQQIEMEMGILRGADGIELWAREGIDAAMNRYNADPV